jgi:hypothetical protein
MAQQRGTGNTTPPEERYGFVHFRHAYSPFFRHVRGKWRRLTSALLWW